MNKYIKTFIISIISFLAGICMTNAKEYVPKVRFESLRSDFLPSNEVRKLYQDSDGFIWIPTYNGLARYDGYDVLSYGTKDVVEGTFNPFVNVVEEDNCKNLWIGTECGLFRLDKITGNIIADEYPELKDCNISAIIADDSGLWVGGDKGLYYKDNQKNDFECIPLSYTDGHKLQAVTSVVKDAHMNLWIASFGNELLRYDVKKNISYPYDHPILNNSHVLKFDSHENLWVGTWGHGLICLKNPYSLEDMTYTQFTHDSANSSSILDNIIYAIEENKEDGSIWAGSRGGLSILSHLEGEMQITNYMPGSKTGDLPYNEVNSIMQSSDGVMWIGMLGGGVCKSLVRDSKFKINPLETVHRKYNTSSVRCMYYEGANNFWLGLLGYGLIEYNKETDLFIDYHDHPVMGKMPYTSTVNSIVRNEQTGELCFGTQNAGVWIYDPARHTTRQLNRYNRKQFLDDCVISLCTDDNGNLWIGARTGVYIESMDGTFYNLAEWLGKPTPLEFAFVFDICKGKNGEMWIATNGLGILKVSSEDKDFKHFMIKKGMISDYVYSILADDSGCIWAGTVADGVAVLSPQDTAFRPVKEFPNIENKGINNIIQDTDGVLWMTTSNTAFSFTSSPEGIPEYINTYAASNEIPFFSFSRNSGACIDKGRVAFGGSNGIAIFTDSDTKVERTNMPIVFTDFKVNNVPLRKLEKKEREKVSREDINFAQSIVLSHDKNNFMIEFSMLSYENLQDHIFRYQLKGFDNKYISVDSQHRFASYTNLPAGKYTFILQAVDEKGIWSSNERKLDIKILPAPWLSWWAYLIYTLIGCIIIFIVFRFIEYRFHLLKEIQISKLEKQKTEELNHAKLEFFTNVTHEFMTPLTIIMTSIQSLKAGTAEADQLYPVMSTNATRLMRLIQQILEFRKAESGNLKILVSHGDLVAFTKKCVNAFTPLVASKHMSMYFKTSDEKIEGWFDHDKIDKIVYNLLSNAAKYTPEDGEITVRLEKQDETFVRIFVVNTGELMSQQTIDGLFKRFYDGAYRKYHTVGTGIGLSLIKNLVDIHNGTVTVTSSPEEGNSFCVRIPIAKECYSAEEINEELNDFEEEDEPIFQNMVSNIELDSDMPQMTDKTLLVVDDNEELNLLISNILSPYFHILTAYNGKDAITCLEKQHVDLVISDIMMPIMDGIELCSKIKDTLEYSHIPVILLTAKNSDSSRIEGCNCGADAYITKPFNIKLLYAQIINQLKKVEYRGSDFRKRSVFVIDDLDYTSLDEKFMKDAIDCINKHLSDGNFQQNDFAHEMGFSRTVLTEKLKSLTGLTPNAFVNDIRLRAAYHLLEKERKMRISDLAIISGFNDPKYFSTCFRKKFGLSPKEYIDRLNEKGDKVK